MTYRHHRVTLLLAVGLLAGAATALAAPVCLEAESASAVTAPMAAITNATTQDDAACSKQASGNAFLKVPEGAGTPPEVTTGEATITFTVPKDGTYYFWCRVWWNDGCGNSLGVAIDGAKPFTFGQDSTYKCWHWVKAPPRISQLTLTKGMHTLKLTNREDGVRIDQILFETNARFVPVDIEPVTVAPQL